MTSPHSDLVEEAQRLTELARKNDVPLRLLGGVAVRLRASDVAPQLERDYSDLDWATKRGSSHAVQKLFKEAGYTAEIRFNALYGRERLKFMDETNHRHADVFVGKFRMSHEISLGDRLDADELTVPLAELLLTKLQIAELNEKDVTDAYVLLDSHAVGSDDTTVNGKLIAEVCSCDWGLWRTLTQNLEVCVSRLEGYGLDDHRKERIARRLSDLVELIHAEPKSRKWKLRAKIGDRKRWYELPEEVGI